MLYVSLQFLMSSSSSSRGPTVQIESYLAKELREIDNCCCCWTLSVRRRRKTGGYWLRDWKSFIKRYFFHFTQDRIKKVRVGETERKRESSYEKVSFWKNFQCKVGRIHTPRFKKSKNSSVTFWECHALKFYDFFIIAENICWTRVCMELFRFNIRQLAVQYCILNIQVNDNFDLTHASTDFHMGYIWHSVRIVFRLNLHVFAV